jgi:hypothetical protein
VSSVAVEHHFSTLAAMSYSPLAPVFGELESFPKPRIAIPTLVDKALILFGGHLIPLQAAIPDLRQGQADLDEPIPARSHHFLEPSGSRISGSLTASVWLAIPLSVPILSGRRSMA